MRNGAPNTVREEAERSPLQRLLDREELISGVSLILIALFFMWAARNYPVGTTAVMGPGYFPRALCWIVIAVGILLLLNGFRKGFPVAEREERGRIMPLLFIPGACVFFALTAQSLGLLFSGAGLTLIAAFAHPRRSLVEAVLVTLALAVLSFGLWWAIGIQLPLLPRFL